MEKNGIGIERPDNSQQVVCGVQNMKKGIFACAEIEFSFIAITIFPLDFSFVLLSYFCSKNNMCFLNLVFCNIGIY